MDGGQVSSGIRLQRVGGRRGVAKVGHKLGHFRQCWYGSHTASAVLQMKIVPHCRNGFIMAALFEVKKEIPDYVRFLRGDSGVGWRRLHRQSCGELSAAFR